MRLLVTLAVTAIGFRLGRSLLETTFDNPDTGAIVGAVVGAAVGYVVGGVLGRWFTRSLDTVPERVGSQWNGPELFAGAFGVIVGVLLGAVVAVPIIVFLPPEIGWPLGALLVLAAAALAARIFASRSSELLAMAGLRRRGPLRAERLGSERTAYLLDSSAAIDGGVLELARSRLISGTLWVPAFVVDEMQGLADAGERSRRRRGRRGLDMVEALQDVDGLDVVVLEESVPEFEDVDAKLVALADRASAIMVTTDHNLAKAAGVRGLKVLNPRSLGEALKPLVAVGERLVVGVTKQGSEAGQGVGYLDDGTMVVIEGAAESLGEDVEIEVTSTTRTSIGRMLFGRMVG